MGSVDEFDYIIVGGGTAGLTVADRLTEDENVKVLVVEAGEDRSKDPLVLTPGLVAGMYGNPDYDWNFNSVPQVSDFRQLEVNKLEFADRHFSPDSITARSINPVESSWAGPLL